MAVDLVDLVKRYITPDLIQKAAGYVGETSGATQKVRASAHRDHEDRSIVITRIGRS
jgi:hypothetical protein